MSTPRLFCDHPLGPAAEIAATANQAHYLGSVMRRAIGDPVLLFNGHDGEWAGRIAALRKDRASFIVEARTRPQTAPRDTRLLIAALKRDAMDLVAEKATELGIGLIQPVLTRRCVTDRVNADRLTAIAREAAEQSERLDVPRIAATLPLHAALDAWDAVPLLVGAERTAAPPLAARAPRQAPWAWLVGPEGGFEQVELDDLRRRPFVCPVSLGPGILRAETAAIAGLAILQALSGDQAADWTPG